MRAWRRSCTYGTLRREGTYDAIIADAAHRPVTAIDPPVLDALRLGVHQLVAMRTPSHAAVNETVRQVRQAAGTSAAGFANAVLRRVSERTPEEWDERLAAAARSDDERLAVRYAHPVWVIRAFRRALAAEGRADQLETLLAADNEPPVVTFAALPGLAELPAEATATPYSPIGFRSAGGDPASVVAASGGLVRVQDEGSQLAALALARAVPVRAGEKWLDLCAAPGGKTAVLAAEALAHGASLEANELSPARAGLVRDSVAAIPLPVPVSEEDGRTRAAHGRYDRILVDAPCTGLGALRRRPEARWRKQPADVPELRGAAGRAARGGVRRAHAGRDRRLRHVLTASGRDRRGRLGGAAHPRRSRGRARRPRRRGRAQQRPHRPRRPRGRVRTRAAVAPPPRHRRHVDLAAAPPLT